ncbi:MAG: hypothetical protein Q7T54_01375, partial [Candidatus Levybacteria bacterium]|nr:hypothetical protein [Candidatus Levybacteria bacterium]
SGSFKSFKKDGEDGRSYDLAYLLGATLKGTMLVPGQLKKGMSAEMSIPSETPGIPASNYSSSAVKELGVMIHEKIPPTPTP